MKKPNVETRSLEENDARLARIVLELNKWQPAPCQAKHWSDAMSSLFACLKASASPGVGRPAEVARQD